MDRRAFITMVGGRILTAPLGVNAQNTPRIGYLSAYTPADPRGLQWRAAFQRGLREHGYVDGKNIAIEYRYADGHLARLPELATELVRVPVDVILVTGDASLRAARQATKTIPIVVSVIGDLVGPGHVQSLARPGGNITGLTVLAPELSAKRLELLKETVPKLARVGILRNPTNAVGALDVKAAEGFAVFLTSADAFATPPFGAVEYIGDFTTNAAGIGSLKVDAIIAEAFVSTLVGTTRVRANLDHLVFWFAEPAQAIAACGLTAITPFDGDGQAGPAAMSSQGTTGLEQFP